MKTMLSRVADQLYWLGRYIERAEHSARVLNVQTHLALEEPIPARQQRMQFVLASLRQPNLTFETFEEATHYLTLEPNNPNSVRSCVTSARENARQMRERIASEMWEQVNRLHLHVISEARARDVLSQPHEFFNAILTGLHLFNGITDSVMTRDQAWEFIQVGRWLERAGLLVTILDVSLADWEKPSYLDWLGLLKSCTAFEAYRKLLGSELNPVNIGDFLILSPSFPHSIRFSVAQLRHCLQLLAVETENRKSQDLDRLLGRLHHDLEYARAEEFVGRDLRSNFDRLRSDLMKIHEFVYRLYISWEIEY